MNPTVPTSASFENVNRGQLPSANNENALREAVRELQRYFTKNNSSRFSIGRIDSSNLSNHRPSFSDDEIGVAIVDLGLAWIQSIKTNDYEEYRVETSQEKLRQSVLNVGQRFFSRDEVFGLLQNGSKSVPVQLGGSQSVIAKTTTSIDAASISTDEITPEFGIADIYDWNADGTSLVKIEQQVRLANYLPKAIASGEFVNAFSFGKNYVVNSQNATSSLVRFTLSESLSPLGSADAVINSAGPDDGTTILVSEWTGSSGTTGQQGIAWYDGLAYWVVEILTGSSSSSSSASTAFVLTSAPSFGSFNAITTATANVLTPGGSLGAAIVVKFIGRTRAKVGSRGVAVLVSDEWIVSEIQQPALRIRANLVDTLFPSSTTTTVTQSSIQTPFPLDIPMSAGEPPYSAVTVANPKKLCGFGTAVVDLQYDAATDGYFIDSIERQAFRIRGTVVSDFGSTDTTMNMDTLIGLDGVLPPLLALSDAVVVANVHEWAGSAGSIARAEFNWTNNQWELYQIDCNEDQGTDNPLEEEPI